MFISIMQSWRISVIPCSLETFLSHFLYVCGPTRTSLLRLLDHTHKHTTGRTPVYEWSVRHTCRYLHNTTNTKDEYPCTQRDSNPRSQQSGGYRPTAQTARPPGSAEYSHNTLFNYVSPDAINKINYVHPIEVTHAHYSIRTPLTLL